MSLVIEQRFPLGRFHATRWNQNPFEDSHGEWPPSPWRLLRALAARWAQFRREIGALDDRPRDALLSALAEKLPAFSLPTQTSRGTPLRQYVPVEVGWTNASAGVAAVRKPGKTLVPDTYRVIPPHESVYWRWDIATPFIYRELLAELLRRTLYFGRAETACFFRLLADDQAANIEVNCLLNTEQGTGVPVLAPLPGKPLNLPALLASTDDKLLVSRRIPPGSAWFYAKLPLPRPRVKSDRPPLHFPADMHVVQFAVGGRVFPPPGRWVKVTDRFRGYVLKHRAQQLVKDTRADYQHLSDIGRSELALLSGKDADGTPLVGNRHAYFFLWPDEHGQPTRLVCYRSTPFSSVEVEAMLKASEHYISWKFERAAKPHDDNEIEEREARSEWSLRLVPLPFETPAPCGLFGRAAAWISATPFVSPNRKYRFRENGRLRPGETAERRISDLLVKAGFPAPLVVEPIGDTNEECFVYIHASLQERRKLADERTPAVKPAGRFRIIFSEAVQGPIALGHSSHFGLGLFIPAPQ